MKEMQFRPGPSYRAQLLKHPNDC